jgi:hypothetical protein
MKKLLLSFLFVITAFITQAQDVKPTKEETFNYLKENFFSKEINWNWYYNEFSSGNFIKDVIIYKYINVTLDGCTLHITYSKQSIQSDRQQSKPETPVENKVDINLSKVESVVKSCGIVNNPGRNPQGLIEIIFTEQQPSGKLNKIAIPYLSITSSECDGYDITKDKFFKAFNHLRKLCGAPEPIKFD